jgi:glycosyltransferase involved in cell wall biosynthesis
VLIAGDGPEQAHLQELVRQLHIEDAVMLPGFIPDVESVYAATDLFVFPSHDEPLACAMLSAMARGLPVVAFARGGNPEAIQDGENGLLVKDLDSHALANATARLLLDPAEAQRLGKAARETVSSRFSADRMVDATLRLYEKVTSDW